jgi:AcrR family transcriptional regulator
MKAAKVKAKVAAPSAKTDRRILRTRDTLGDALVMLMQEKNFDDITVQDLLDRAGVGRSTFYQHYRDKDDLFLSDVEDFLQLLSSALNRHGASPRRLLPVQEFFSHVRETHGFYTALVKAGKMDDVQTLARGIFARSIEERLQRSRSDMEPAQQSAHAHALAGSVFSLLDWWIDKGMKADPREMDEVFHRLAWNGLGGWPATENDQTH